MPLLSIDRLESFVVGDCGGLGQVYEAVLPEIGRVAVKFKPNSWCEALGYQVAERLGASVLSAVPFWSPHGLTWQGSVVGAGRIGVALRRTTRFTPIRREWAAQQAPDVVVGALVLAMLGRDEWFEFAETERGVIVYDLEHLFAGGCIELAEGEGWDVVLAQVRECAIRYREAHRWVDLAIEEAARLSLEEPLRLAVANAIRLADSELFDAIDMQPHPLAAHVKALAVEAVMLRLGDARLMLHV